MTEETESYKTPVVVATSENPPVIDTSPGANKISASAGQTSNSNAAAAAAAAAVAAVNANANAGGGGNGISGGVGASAGNGTGQGQLAEIGPVWPSPAGPPVEDFNYFFNSALSFQQNGYFFQNFGPPPNMSELIILHKKALTGFEWY